MKENKGKTLVEYALILFLVAVGVVLSLTSLGNEVDSALVKTSNSFGNGVVGHDGISMSAGTAGLGNEK